MSPHVRLKDIAFLFLRLGATSFGGSMLPLMEEAVVQKRKWVSADQFIERIALAQLVPGPIAIKVAFSVGECLRGTLGAFVAVLGFCLPSFFLVSLAGFLLFQTTYRLPLPQLIPLVSWVVVGLFLLTAWRLGKKALRSPASLGIALGAAAHQLGLSPLFILWTAGLFSLAGWEFSRRFGWKCSSG